jgi:tetratricopeptide (TPR) repeat protein
MERAESIAEQWLTRDQLDPEALVALSDAVARLGRRDEALRLLTGVVDLEPDNAALHDRLAQAYDRAGDALRACGHRVAVAESESASNDAVAAAVRCERALGRHAAATQLLDALSDAAQRAQVERAVARPPQVQRVAGDVFIDATWAGLHDLDVALVNARGERISWMGGRPNVVGEAARTPGRERLGLRWTPVGTYYIEVSRTDPGDSAPVSGTLSVQALGTRRSIPFVLTGPTARVGGVRVRREARLVPTGF